MTDERWLVKSSSKILGPFTLEELIQHLRARTISIIDEVRDPLMRWVFIREQPLLQDVVQQLRLQQDYQNEVTQSGASITQSDTASVTENLLQEGEFTPSPHLTSSNLDKQGEASLDFRPIHGLERNLQKNNSVHANMYGSAFEIKDRIQRQAKKKKMLYFFLFFLFSVLTLCGIFFWQKQKLFINTEEKAKQKLILAREQIKFGQYAEALENFNFSRGLIKFSDDDLIFSSALLLFNGGGSIAAIRDLEQINQNADSKSLRDRDLLFAIAQMQEQHWNDAYLALNGLLQKQPLDVEALHNLALLEFYRGHHIAAQKVIDQLKVLSYTNSEFLLLRGFLQIAQMPMTSISKELELVREALRLDIENNFEFKFEKLLVLFLLDSISKKNDKVDVSIKNIWMFDPTDSRNYAQNLFVDHQIMKGDRWNYICQKVGSLLYSQEQAAGVNSSCFAVLGENGQAISFLQDARKKISDSRLLEALQALMLYRSGAKAESAALVKLSNDQVQSKIVIGLACIEEKNWDCAEKVWTELAQISPVAPLTLNSLRTVYKQRGNISGAEEVLRRGLKLAPQYRPFLEAKGGIE